ncbi:MAG: malate dehydrogenase [Thermoplasmata archaeon]
MAGWAKKIAVIGAGNTGGSIVQRFVDTNIAPEIVVTDVIENIAQGKALDILESTPISGIDCNVYGSTDMSIIKDSDVVVVTAGMARKPGMSRLDLLTKNAEIIYSVTSNIKKYAPNSIIVMLSNPLDVTTYIAYKASGFKPNKVIGMAGVLDSARFRTFIAQKLHVSVKDVTSIVMGGHGDTMVPILSHTHVGGIPVKHLLKKEDLDAMITRTRNGGGEIVNLLKAGSAYYAPSYSILEMVSSIVHDKKQILPCSVYLDGQYGAKDLFIGVPAKLGKNGVEEVIELKLEEDEKQAFQKSIEEIKKEIAECPPQFLKPA